MGEGEKVDTCYITFSKPTIANTSGSPQWLKIVALTSSFLYPRHFPGSSFISYQDSSSHPVCQICLHHLRLSGLKIISAISKLFTSYAAVVISKNPKTHFPISNVRLCGNLNFNHFNNLDNSWTVKTDLFYRQHINYGS